MTSYTIIYRSNNNTNLETLLKQLGTENIEAIYTNSNCLYTLDSLKSKKKNTKVNTVVNNIQKTELEKFAEKYKLKSSWYSDKSIILKKTDSRKGVSAIDKILGLDEISK